MLTTFPRRLVIVYGDIPVAVRIGYSAGIAAFLAYDASAPVILHGLRDTYVACLRGNL